MAAHSSHVHLQLKKQCSSAICLYSNRCNIVFIMFAANYVLCLIISKLIASVVVQSFVSNNDKNADKHCCIKVTF